MAKETRESDPLVGFQFAIEVDGPVQVTGYFTEVTGIGSESELIEHKVVDESGREVIQMIPGRLKWNPVTLKRGITHDLSFWEWRQLIVDGEAADARANCSIVMFDRNYSPIVRWDFVNAWPSKISGPEAKADSNDFAIEELTIVHEGMRRVE
jgi:phage tail-like protein